MHTNEVRVAQSPYDPELFVPHTKEHAYCRKYRMNISRLPNGATIIAVPRNVEDVLNLTVKFNFPTGSYFDPPGKSGLHHFVEHILAGKTRQIAKLSDSESNANTSNSFITTVNWGVAHPDVPDYGVWPVFSTIKNQLISPLAARVDPVRVIQVEKEVIKGEIHRAQYSHEYQSANIVNEILYSPKNPLRTNTLGTIEDVDSITQNDVEEFVEERLLPDGLVVTIFTEGEDRILNKALREIIDLVSDLSLSGKKSQPHDLSLYELVNPDFKANEVYIRNTGLHNNTSNVRFIWPIAIPVALSVEACAFEIIFGQMIGKFEHFIRESGLTSYVQFGLIDGGYKNKFGHLGLDTPSREDLMEDMVERLLPAVRDELYQKLDDAELKRLIEKNEKNRRAVPMLKSELLEKATLGLQTNGCLLDAEKIWERYRSLKEEDLRDWRDRILDIKPVVAIIGDIR